MVDKQGHDVTRSVVIGNSPSIGPANAPVTIVEFTDYACEFCKRHATTVLPALLRLYGNRIHYVLRNLPLSEMHPDAEKAAEAVECAGDQGKLWAFHDAAFALQPRLTPGGLQGAAARLHLDVDRLVDCVTTSAKYGQVQDDVIVAQRLGLQSTPAFVINGKVVIGAKSLEVFQGLIDQALRG